MNAVRAGSGPGVGYKSIHAVLIFKNETVYKQFTTIGVQVSASGDALLKVAGHGTEMSKAIATGMGFPEIKKDFGQTMGYWGLVMVLISY